MNGSINFPNLGIFLSNVPKSFSIGPVTIACYGVVLAIAMVTGIWIIMKLAKLSGEDPDTIFDLGIITLALGVAGARIYYVIFSWDYYAKYPLEIFNFRKGGLAIYGGILTGILVMHLLCRHKKMKTLRVLDIVVAGVAWGQMLGRWGNFFNREAFGDYTDNLLAMQLPVSDIRSYEITAAMSEHISTINGVDYVQVHPAFLYESLWNLLVFLVLIFLLLKVKKKKTGMVFAAYLMLYGAGRFWIEGLRTDQLLLPGTALPVSQLLSALLFIGAAIWGLTPAR